MNVTIKTGSADVIATGDVFAFDDKNLSIHLDNIDGGGEKYTLVFTFSTDETKVPRIDTVPSPNAQESVLRLVNYTDPIGVGSIAPIPFATNPKGRSLQVCVLVSQLPNSHMKRVSYTVFRVEGNGK